MKLLSHVLKKVGIVTLLHKRWELFRLHRKKISWEYSCNKTSAILAQTTENNSRESNVCPTPYAKRINLFNWFWSSLRPLCKELNIHSTTITNFSFLTINLFRVWTKKGDIWKFPLHSHIWFICLFCIAVGLKYTHDWRTSIRFTHILRKLDATVKPGRYSKFLDLWHMCFAQHLKQHKTRLFHLIVHPHTHSCVEEER